MDEEYLRGAIGSRDELTAFVDLLPADEASVRATLGDQPHDETFAGFLALVREVGAEIEVVSDGYGFYVEPGLASLGVLGVPIATASTSWASGRPVITYPYGNADCLVCGTCKRERVRRQKARGRHAVMVGDGVSDRYGAAHADTIFAKSLLAGICDDLGWDYQPWETFADIAAWLREVAAHPGRLTAPVERPFICGAEVWGPGRHNPPHDVRRASP